MPTASLLDLPSAAIVIGGALAATVLRSGWGECRITLRELGRLFAPRFQSARARSELAVQVQEIRQDGILRAQPHHTGDSEFDEATDALIRQRSIAALVGAHERHRARRQHLSNVAVRFFAQAAELAPVFGMVGTLISLNRLPSDPTGDFSGAIGMAVLTTLYGLLAANLLFAPLARVLERASSHEEGERQKLVDWLAAQVAEACPQVGPAERRGRISTAAAA